MRIFYEQADEIVTTDNTYQVITNLVVSDNTSIMVHFEIVAARIDGSAGTAGDNYKTILEAQFSNTSGSINSPLPVVSIYTCGTQQSGGSPIWLTQFDIIGRNLRMRVRGATNNNIHWKAYKTITIL